MVALTYPNNPTEADKKNYLNFFKSLQDVLPCPICAEHFKEQMEQYPIRLENTESLFRWTVDIHNKINKENNKNVLSYDEAIDEINKNSFPKNDNHFKKAILLSSSVSAMIVLFAYYLSKRK